MERQDSSITAGFLTVPEFAEALGVRPESVRHWILMGELPAIKLGQKRLIPVDALKRMIERQEADRGSEHGTR